ncbi:MAG: adenosylcobinamide-GDP ribazoletransferase [Planctomycetaceae bacterium]|nr:adenosylcobinamide-GDP ribazoletransferase [Planctomycetaceae bacterium]
MMTSTTSEMPQRTGIQQQWWAFVTAIQFLTRLPVSSRTADPQALRDCPRYFPLVGGMIAVITIGLIWVSAMIWPFWLAVMIALALELRLTGAMHEDAVADCFDAFGGGWTRERVLEIMKDSRLGTYGVLGLISAVMIRAGATIQLIQQIGLEEVVHWGVVLLASGVLGRGVILFTMWLIPPIENRESLSRDVGQQMELKDLAIGSIWTAPILIIWCTLFPLQAIIGLAGLAMLIFWFRGLVLKKLGGITGDCLGCIGYSGQVVILLASIAEWPA